MIIIDYIEAVKYCVTKPKLDNFDWNATYSGGSYQYYCNVGYDSMRVTYNEIQNSLTVSGSVMYFMQGHNLTYDRELFIDGINQIGNMLDVNLWDSEVNCFECGAIIEVEYPAREYIAHTRRGKNMWEDTPHDKKSKGFCMSFNDDSCFVYRKMYDVGHNLTIKRKGKNKTLDSIGWDTTRNYLKWEVKYKQPVKVFGRTLMLSDLVNPEWESLFKQDCYSQYLKLDPMKSLKSPTDVKKLKAIDVVTINYCEMCFRENKRLGEIRKLLNNCLNTRFRNVLIKKTTRDSRRISIKKVFDRLNLSNKSEWDLCPKLYEAIFEMPHETRNKEDCSTDV
ncbi:MAG: hypothetical protein J6U04_03030 [Salinivirgaceae bacterium]|nr:hypothetical protein [Salinivirgaceae bacterium]